MSASSHKIRKEDETDAARLRSAFVPHRRIPYTGIDEKTGEVLPSLTKQSFVEECDINNILKQQAQTGVMRHLNERAEQGMYVDLPEPMEFQDAFAAVQAAQDAFATLPSQLRSRFQNAPEQFLAFMADPANQDEIIKLGLAKDLRPIPGPNPDVPNQVEPKGSPEAAKGQPGGAGDPPRA